MTLWIGPKLGPVERACLRSVVRQGHQVTLYCYSTPGGVPSGVTTADAAEIIPEREIIRYRTGSHSLFSNRFRYELQRRGAGTWIDCDLYFISPLDGTRPFLCGEQAAGEINGAVLRIPSDSALLPALLEPFFERVVPEWLPLRDRLAACLRRFLTGRTGVSRMRWGTTGPAALTFLPKRLGIDLAPVSPRIFYPVPWQRAEWIFEPGRTLEAEVFPETVAVHLWNERIKHRLCQSPADGTFAARLFAEGA